MRRTAADPARAVVFLGPSLPVDRARRIVDARFVAPARCGDVLAYLRTAPSAIVVVDGVFERVPAVWHKELLYALELGVPVYGAASMGALRAAELGTAGMVGVGEVHRRFATGIYTDDDEVAVAHADASEEFRSLSDALVNIRATLEAAAGVIGPHTAAAVLGVARATFYAERSMVRAVKGAWGQADDADLDRLEGWVAEHGLVDQKRLDTEAVLRTLAAGSLEVPDPPPSVPRTVFFAKLARLAGCTALPAAVWVPEVERQAAEAVADPVDGWLLGDMAGLLAAASAVGATLDGPGFDDPDFVVAGPPDGPLARACRLLRPDGWRAVLPDVLRAYGAAADAPGVAALPAAALEAVADRRFAAFRRIAKLWHGLEAAAASGGVASPPGRAGPALDQFCAARGLDGPGAVDAWCSVAGTDRAGLARLAARADLIGWLVENTAVLGAVPEVGHCWLHDAVELSRQRAGPSAASPARGADWTADDALAAAYRYLAEVLVPAAPDLLARMAGPSLDRMASDAAALLVDAHEHLFFRPTDDERRRVLDALPVGRALDYGCGAGFNALRLALVGHQVAVVDNNETKLAFLRWAAGRLGVAERVSVGWVGEFDAVVCINVLDHLDDGSGLVEQFAECLRPGGRLALYAHFTPDGAHTSAPAVVGRVVAALDRHFDRPDEQPSSLEVWLRRPAGAARTRWLVPGAGAPPVAEARPRRHREVAVRPTATGLTAGGTRFWQRARPVSRLGARVLESCDGHRRPAAIAAEIGADEATVVAVVAELFSARFVSLGCTPGGAGP